MGEKTLLQCVHETKKKNYVIGTFALNEYPEKAY